MWKAFGGASIETWQEFGIGPGQGSKLRQESDFRLERKKVGFRRECDLGLGQ